MGRSRANGSAARARVAASVRRVFLDDRGRPGAVLHFIPDGYASIWCEIRPQRPVKWFLRGPIPGPSWRRFRSSLLLAGVRLRPGVPHLLTSGPVDQLVGRRIRLTDAPWARALVAACHTIEPDVHLRSLERFLMERFAGASVHPHVTAAIDAIKRTNGRSAIALVADLCQVSPRHLTRLMGRWTTSTRRAAKLTVNLTGSRVLEKPWLGSAVAGCSCGCRSLWHATPCEDSVAGGNEVAAETRSPH